MKEELKKKPEKEGSYSHLAYNAEMSNQISFYEFSYSVFYGAPPLLLLFM